MKFAVLIPSVLIFQSNESEEPGLWKSIQIQGHQPAKSGPYFKTKGFLSARQWLQAHSRLWHPPISSTDILGFIPVHSWVWDLGCQSSFSCLLLRHSYFGHRTRQPLTHWPDACMLSSVGGQSSHDPEVRVWWLSPWLAFLCLKGKLGKLSKYTLDNSSLSKCELIQSSIVFLLPYCLVFLPKT